MVKKKNGKYYGLAILQIHYPKASRVMTFAFPHGSSNYQSVLYDLLPPWNPGAGKYIESIL